MNKQILRKILYITLIIIISILLYFIFKIEKENEILESNEGNIGKVSENTILPTPDRIIYKNKDDKYIIINSGTREYAKIYSELYIRITNIIEGKVYSEQEITNMQSKGSFIELDYNTKSKNFIFMLEESEIGIIRRFTDSGQVIKTSILNKEELIKKMDKLTKDEDRYDFNKENNFISQNKLTEIPKDIQIPEVRGGVYQKVIKDESEDYKEILNKLNFKTDKKVPNINFEKQTIILTLSHYEIKNITQNIGNIKYEFGECLNEYTVNVLIASKVVNTDCIYYNITDIGTYLATENNIYSNKDEFQVDYVVEDFKYYALADQKTEIISPEKACDIADEEAKDEKYQYQGWKSEFYTRGKNKDGYITAELISNLSQNNKLICWEEKWQKRDYNGKLMWKIFLSDENDPLTGLYIYIDAVNGNIIGAGAQSD